MQNKNTIKKSEFVRLVEEIIRQVVKEMAVEEETATAAVSPVTGPNFLKKKTSMGENKEEIDEMTTTSGGGGSSVGTTGYNVPGAFSRKGGSKAGIRGSESLGYKLTPQGEKDMQMPADKLYEKKK